MDENILTYFANIQTELEPLLDSVKVRLSFTEAPGSEDDLYATPWIAVPREILPAVLEHLTKRHAQLQQIASFGDHQPDLPN